MPSSTTLLTESADLRNAFRTEMGKISRQSAVFFAGTVFTLVAGFFFKIYTARVLGAEGIGLYALGTSVVAFFSLFAHWGIPRAMVRFIPMYAAQNDAARIRGLIVRGGLVVALVSSTLGIVLFLTRDEIATRIFSEPALAPILALFAFSIPLGTLGFLLDQIAVGFQQTARSKSINSFFTYPLLIVLTVIFLNLGWGVSGYVLATLFSSAAGILVLMRVVQRLVPAAVHHSSLEPAVWRYAGAMAFLGIWGFLSGEADKLILGIYLPTASVGVYSVALTIAAFIPMLLTSVNSIFAPTISHLYAQGQYQLLEQLFQTLTKWVLGFTLPLIGVIFCFAPELMGIFGSEFRTGWSVLVIVALGQLVNVSTGSVGMMLWMSGHESVSVRSQIASSLVSLSVNLSLIPALGIMGAAIAQLLGLVINNVIAVLFVGRKLKMYPHHRRHVQLLIPTMMVVGVITLWRVFALESWGALNTVGSALVTSYLVFVSAALSIGLDSNDRLVLDATRARLVSLVRLVLFRG